MLTPKKQSLKDKHKEQFHTLKNEGKSVVAQIKKVLKVKK